MKVVHDAGRNYMGVTDSVIAAVTRPITPADWDLISICVGQILPVEARKKPYMVSDILINPFQCLSDEDVVREIHIGKVVIDAGDIWKRNISLIFFGNQR